MRLEHIETETQWDWDTMRLGLTVTYLRSFSPFSIIY